MKEKEINELFNYRPGQALLGLPEFKQFGT